MLWEKYYHILKSRLRGYCLWRNWCLCFIPNTQFCWYGLCIGVGYCSLNCKLTQKPKFLHWCFISLKKFSIINSVHCSCCNEKTALQNIGGLKLQDTSTVTFPFFFNLTMTYCKWPTFCFWSLTAPEGISGSLAVNCSTMLISYLLCLSEVGF